MTRTTRTDTREDGFVTAEWVLGVALLLIPVLLLLAVLAGWASLREAASAAAREAARTAAGAPADHAAAVDAAEQVLADRGVDWAGATVDVTVPSADVREGEVTATVSVPGRPVGVPLIGELAPPTATASHTRLLDPWRSRS